jgi:signal transduction histidine kinase/CheY-like chemotaxis protein/HPt (histidine-containing phosphotransfer) domain-containing protein
MIPALPVGGLGAEVVPRAFPFFVGFDAELRIAVHGAALAKLEPALAIGAPLVSHFHFEGVEERFASFERMTSRLLLCRSRASGATLRGQLVPDHSGQLLLFLCTPWLTSTEELLRHGLLLGDFPPNDPIGDLLQVLQIQETTLADVRKLVAKLSGQRKEQRLVGARVSALYDVSRLLAEGPGLAEATPRLLESVLSLTALPLAFAEWSDGSRGHVALRARHAADGGAQLRQLLLEEHATRGAPDWAATEVPLVSRLEVAPASRRGQRLVSLGLNVGYQIQIEGSGGPLGLIEVYGEAVPAQEPGLRSALGELGIRLVQYAEKLHADAALRESSRAAAAAVTAKSQFLARMSHEIRTPINGVLGMIELAISSELTPRQRARLETARSSGELLLGLVNDVLDFSKIEAGFLELERSTFDVRACLKRAFQLFESKSAAKGLSYTLVLDPELPPSVIGDELRLSQVLVNLIGNAFKFTRTGGIEVSAELRGAHLRDEDPLVLQVAVRDTGIGIPAERREAIFSSFTQAEVATAREFGGTGLGLAITKQLVELMGGNISVLSEVGQGSEFRFHVQLTAAPRDGAAAPPPDAPLQPLPPLRILVVEDNEINQVVVRGLLERDGHMVEIADRMESAIVRGCDGSWSAILMDVQLPDGDGMAATAAIRSHAWRGGLPMVPIIGLSAQAVAGDRERALASGMDEYLTKPVRPAQLAEALRRLCSADEVRRRRSSVLRQASPPTSAAIVSARVSSSPLRIVTDEPVALAPTPGGWASDDQEGFLEKLREFDDLGDMIPTMARALAHQAAECVEEIERALLAGDRPGVAFLAHRLAGSAGAVGARTLERAARELERAMRHTSDGPLSLQPLRDARESWRRLVTEEALAGLIASSSAGAAEL